MIKTNFHSHTFLCGHAGGAPMDYVIEAIKHNYTHLGISEHAPMPNLRSTNSRLELKNYDLYFKLLNEAKDYAKNYNLTLYKGFEIEYFKHLENLYPKYLKDVDYLILGQHYIMKNGKEKSTYTFDDLEDIKIYVETVVEALNTNHFSILAHPELCFFNFKEVTNEMVEMLRPIIKTAKSLDIPLEINANGLRRSKYEDKNEDLSKVRYPKINFFKMVKEEGAKVIIGSDAHSVDALDDFATTKAYQIASDLDLSVVYFPKGLIK